MIRFIKNNLQLFAADAGGGSGENISDNAADVQAPQGEDVQNAENKESESKTYTDDDIAKIKDDWAKEQEKANQEKINKEVERQLKEQKRLSELSKEEREREEQDAKEKALKEREDKLLFKERLSDVKDELLNRKLPISFAKYFVNEDNEKSLKEISDFEKLFRAEIQNEVNSKIKGVTLKTGDSTTNAGKSMAEQRNAQKQITNNPWA